VKAAIRRWPSIVLALALAAIVYMPVCDLVYDCGCTWPLLGDWQHCDIHTPGPPDCPICTSGWAVQGGFWLAIALPLFAAGEGARAGWRRLRA
jgi:hypothetical protein